MDDRPRFQLAEREKKAEADFAMRDPNDLFLGQLDGTFVEHAADAGLSGFERGRGAALVDLNLDGKLDLVVVNRMEPASIWRNVGGGTADQRGAQHPHSPRRGLGRRHA